MTSAPMAWLVKSKAGMIRSVWTEEPAPEQLEIAKLDGDVVIPLYAALDGDVLLPLYGQAELDAAIAAERERCAVICEAGMDGTSKAYADACYTCATAIRGA